MPWKHCEHLFRLSSCFVCSGCVSISPAERVGPAPGPVRCITAHLWTLIRTKYAASVSDLCVAIFKLRRLFISNALGSEVAASLFSLWILVGWGGGGAARHRGALQPSEPQIYEASTVSASRPSFYVSYISSLQRDVLDREDTQSPNCQ